MQNAEVEVKLLCDVTETIGIFFCKWRKEVTTENPKFKMLDIRTQY